MGEGLNNAEIAERLFITPLTAKTHVSRIMTKLLVRDRAQLVVLAYESGLRAAGLDRLTAVTRAEAQGREASRRSMASCAR